MARTKGTSEKVDFAKRAGDEAMLKATTDQITKKFGEGSIMKLGEGASLDIEVIPTGSLSLDAALGIGGVPRGRIVEVYGPESSGKTTLALSIVAEAQAQGGIAAFIDAEHALDPIYAARLGVDIDELLISQPDTGEQALEICDMLVRSNAVACIVVDSVAALVPRAEIEGEIGDTTVGLQARLMSQALRKLAGSLSKSNTTCIFINQLREKIGVAFGNPETTTGGRALKFFSSVRLDIRRVETIKEHGDAIGNRVRVKIVKNKCAAPFRQAEFDLMYGTGISKEGCILDMAVDAGVVAKSGAWYTYGPDRLGQGREAAKATLAENPDLRRELEGKVRESMGIGSQGPAAGDDEAAGDEGTDSADNAPAGDDEPASAPKSDAPAASRTKKSQTTASSSASEAKSTSTAGGAVAAEKTASAPVTASAAK